jgi:hypothetical protein
MSREQQYWLPGFGLSRHIVLGHIQYFLGPNASARPFTYQVPDHFSPLWERITSHLTCVLGTRGIFNQRNALDTGELIIL